MKIRGRCRESTHAPAAIMKGQTTGLIWDLGDEGWGSWKNAVYPWRKVSSPFRHEGFTGHPDEIVGATSSIDRVCGRDPGFVFRSREFLT
ncbi:MAG: hypothetical protein R3B66_11880 [Candidatus Scalinduaceae bacterium]